VEARLMLADRLLRHQPTGRQARKLTLHLTRSVGRRRHWFVGV